MIAEDLALLREGISSLLRDAGLEVVAEVSDAESLLRVIEAKVPDIAVVDIRMPPTHTDEGIEAAHRIHRRWPEIGVLVLSQYVDTNFAWELISEGRGRTGYLLKDRVGNKNEFVDAVRRVAAGGTVIDPEVVARLVDRRRKASPVDELSDREREVLAMMAEGRSNQAIATSLFMASKTVEAHVRSIFMKLGLEVTADDHRRVLAVLTYLRS